MTDRPKQIIIYSCLHDVILALHFKMKWRAASAIRVSEGQVGSSVIMELVTNREFRRVRYVRVHSTVYIVFYCCLFYYYKQL